MAESTVAYIFGISYIKHNIYIMYTGVLLTLIGQYIRTKSMLTCGSNFTHIISQSRSQSHQLITHGLYSVVRHPGYTGWFILSISQQILLCNPLCLVAYTYMNYQFFHSRIIYEELKLFEFFGVEYEKYWYNVPYSGVPFVNTDNILNQDIHGNNIESDEIGDNEIKYDQ